MTSVSYRPEVINTFNDLTEMLNNAGISRSHRLRIHRCATRGISCLTYTSYARAFLASTHARFNKELDGETSNKRRF